MGCRVLVEVLLFGVRVGVREFGGSAGLKTLCKEFLESVVVMMLMLGEFEICQKCSAMTRLRVN